MTGTDGRVRVVIDKVLPQIDGGRFPIKRVVGESVGVEAHIFADGHDLLGAVLRHRKEGAKNWTESPMQDLVNDVWRGSFEVDELGVYVYTVQAWIDRYGSWRRDLKKRVEAGQDVKVDLMIGAKLLESAAAGQAPKADADRLRQWAKQLQGSNDQADAARLALDEQVCLAMSRYAERPFPADYERELKVVVDPVRARFSSWYELFPRSCALEVGKHGTFKDCEDRLPYIAGMGFDVIYLPPIHPVGTAFRKGKNNAVKAEPGDVGSPWGIGSKEGGHKSVHPELGTLADFRRFVAKARVRDIDIALDIAFQCSPDHPYVKEHPDWFIQRPDGSIQYAENPPKKYQDIYPINFESPDWKGLWEELRGIFLYWLEQGVHIFRVDNPHTKSFGFWEWCINSVKAKHPEAIFLAEAFTRPKVMYRLAKLGYSQSYTYFTWRNTKWELEEYFKELTQTDVREFFRPNLWPNTPDILHEYLQHGGRPAFLIRLVLAATLGANYGIYGPAYELCDHIPREPGSEEYLNSEKYEIKNWNLDSTDSLRDLIARVNRIRKDNSALHANRSLQFHPISNDNMLCYSKNDPRNGNIVLTVVNLDPFHTQSGIVDLPLEKLGLDGSQPIQVHDQLGDARYAWHGGSNFVELNPFILPAHIFRIRHRVRTERDFEYYW